MKKIAAFLACMFMFLTGAAAQGTLPFVLQQQFAFTGCVSTPTTGACGVPLSGGLLYFFQVGTVATQQDSFQDTGLTIKNSWPLVLDANGRVPPFYLANGSIHVRLTDSSGVQQFDVPSMLVIGPSGGGGGGGSVDPTAIASTGDIKFRATGETLTGWVRINGQTIGSAISGATGRANADTQALFIYLYSNCIDAHCPVSGGRTGNALNDFNANKTLTLLDWRGRGPIGVDDMGNVAAGRLQAGNVTSGGGDGVTTVNATGGVSFVLQAQNQLPNIAPATTLTYDAAGLNQTNQITPVGTIGNQGGGASWVLSPNKAFAGAGNDAVAQTLTFVGITKTLTALTASINGNVGQQNMFTMGPFMLGSWYIKL